jgi:hypothetical protein
VFCWPLIVLLSAAADVAAAPQGPMGGDLGLPASFDGPAPPTPPLLVSRDSEGRATIRAVAVDAPLRLDGQLDEPVYARLEPVSDFIQMEPDAGQPATEKTEVWLLFDREHVYVTFRAWESQPDRLLVNEMRRDSNNIRQGDSLGFSFDTFYDRRNAVLFEVNALGGRTDGQSTNERQYNGDWNPVWELATGRFDNGWTIEIAIPFKSLRYRPGRAQVWGFNARRISKWKNEISYVTRVPPSFGMGRGDFSASLYATVVGLEAPPGSMNLEIKPYAVADVTSERIASSLDDDFGRDVGLDVKYGVTQSLTADFTYNTDFAQVEADEQQVNLTRFSLFFPEKREFFLENQGTFIFGGAQTGGQMGNAGEVPILFYSRRIGLSGGREVPILAGGRITGRSGRFSLGAINISTRDEPSASAQGANFSVVRVKRDVLRRSSIGAIVTSRSLAQSGEGSNQAYGIDGTFAFFDNLSINTYWAKTRSEALAASGDSAISYRAQVEYNGDRYGVQAERLDVGRRFSPDIGYVRRSDMRRNYGQFRFSPRPSNMPSIRKFFGVGTLTYITDWDGRLETRDSDGEFAIEFQNSDRFSAGVTDSYELLREPFPITPEVSIAPGAYDFTTWRTSMRFGQQRNISGTLTAEHGTFYDGRLTTLSFNRTRVNLTSAFSFEPNISINWADLPAGAFTTTLTGSRVTYTMTPLMFASALIQYNSSTNRVSTNVRLRWEYRPGSELFVVYNEERDTLTAPRIPNLQNRAFIVKINRLFRL